SKAGYGAQVAAVPAADVAGYGRLMAVKPARTANSDRATSRSSSPFCPSITGWPAQGGAAGAKPDRFVTWPSAEVRLWHVTDIGVTMSDVRRCRRGSRPTRAGRSGQLMTHGGLGREESAVARY